MPDDAGAVLRFSTRPKKATRHMNRASCHTKNGIIAPCLSQTRVQTSNHLWCMVRRPCLTYEARV